MRPPWKRHPQPAAAPRPNYTTIAVLEHDLFGVQPEPGTAAAAVIAMRRLGTCFTHQPVETTTLGELVRNGICSRRGRTIVLDDAGILGRGLAEESARLIRHTLSSVGNRRGGNYAPADQGSGLGAAAAGSHGRGAIPSPGTGSGSSVEEDRLSTVSSR